MPELDLKTESRVRMNFGMNAKGLVQLDVTVEFPTVEEAQEAAVKAIEAYKAICVEKGLTLVSAAA